jgi:hypothetical protein
MMAEENGAGWQATAVPEVQAAAKAAGVVGYHISGLYSPLGWLSWEEVARGWEGVLGNDATLKTLKNTILGETWQERGEAPDWQRLYERRADWQLGTAPGGALLLTAGADVQRDRIEVDVWGWGRDLRSWLVDKLSSRATRRGRKSGHNCRPSSARRGSMLRAAGWRWRGWRSTRATGPRPTRSIHGCARRGAGFGCSGMLWDAAARRGVGQFLGPQVSRSTRGLQRQSARTRPPARVSPGRSADRQPMCFSRCRWP